MALAHEMGVSVRQVVQMIERLERLGYVEEMLTGCGQPCVRCPVREVCLFYRRPRLWTLTHKAEKYLATEVKRKLLREPQTTAQKPPGGIV